jgi:agmatine deiminase
MQLRYLAAGSAIATLAAAAFAFGPDEPILINGELVYPEDANIPAYLTPTEMEYVRLNPLHLLRDATPPPTGPVHCAAEYEPMDGILLSWDSYSSLLTQMGVQITTTGDANVYIACDSSSEVNSARNALQGAGADMDRVFTFVRYTDTVWIRDYGPRYIYEGDCRAIVDHTYNRPRPNDNALNGYFGSWIGHEVYELPLVHGGGNYHLNALDEGHATRLIANENPGMSDAEIIGHWRDYQNVETTLWTPFPSYVDSTQHIDMWMIIVGDQNIIISDWPFDSGSTQDAICDNAAADFQSRGWQVTRVPARQLSWTHYTYTNAVICNDLVLVPQYTTSGMVGYNDDAIAAYQAALPDATIVGLNCESIIQSAGAMHCIVMHVPAHRGGVNPTAYLRGPNGGDTYDPGQTVEIQWISDDDDEVVNVDLLLSTNGGASFGTVIADQTTDDGAFIWTVPDVYTTQGVIRVVARDADGNTGFDDSDATFTIDGTPPDCPEDLNGDGSIDLADLGILLASYNVDGGGDIDGDGDTDLADLGALLARYGQDC